MDGYTVKITSVIEELDSAGLSVSSETSEETARAAVRSDGDCLTVSFTERSEGAKSLATFTLSGDTLTVSRTGAIESTLVFQNGKSYKTLYKIPPYAFDMTVKTLRLDIGMTEAGGEISVLYTMSIGGADKRVRMKIFLMRGDV